MSDVPAEVPEAIRAGLLALIRVHAADLTEKLNQPSPFRDWLRKAEQPAGIRACFCPPMTDSSDPDQHEIGCLHAAVIRAHAFWDPQFGEAAATLRSTWGLNHRPSRSLIPGGCYEASWGWVHVRPGCHCR